MKKYPIKYCDDCLWLCCRYNEIDRMKIYKCSHLGIRNNDEDKLIHISKLSIHSAPDKPIDIPEWCPLEDY